MMSSRRMTASHRALTGWALACVLLLPAADRKEDLGRRAERVAAMSTEEKQKLVEQRERFAALPPKEQTRLRELHAALERHPNSRELRAVLQNYYRWLSTLSPTERAELLAMSREKRLENIERRLREEERKRFFELSDRQLTPADHEAIHAWLKQVVASREERILERLPRLKSIEPPRRYRYMLSMMMVGLGSESERAAFLRPTEKELEKLVASLCPKAQDFLKDLDSSPTKRQVLEKWIRTAIHSRFYPPVDNSKLLELLKTLPAEQRSRLEGLSRNEMFKELRRLYFRRRFPYRPGDGARRPGGSGIRGPGIGPRGPGKRAGGPGRFGKGHLKGLPPGDKPASADKPGTADQSPPPKSE